MNKILIVAAVFTLCSCAREQDQQPQKKSEQLVLAWIDDEPITKEEFVQWYGSLPKLPKHTSKATSIKMLKGYIRHRMIVKIARDNDYHKRAKVIRVIRNHLVLTYLQENLFQKISSQKPTTKDILDFYRSNKSRFIRPEMRRLSIILVRCSGNKVTAECSSKARDLGAILSRANFSTLARKLSDEKYSRRRGGDVGFLSDPKFKKTKRPYLEHKIIEHAFKIKSLHKPSGPILGSNGYYFLMVTRLVKGATMAMASQHGRILQMMKAERRKVMTSQFYENIENKFRVKIDNSQLRLLFK